MIVTTQATTAAPPLSAAAGDATFILSLDIGSGAAKAALLRFGATPVRSVDSGASFAIDRIYSKEAVCHIGLAVAAQPQPRTPGGKRAIPKEAVDSLFKAI
ncbi:Hypothetical protein, putative [Bodo saltans]|uniref:Uncharacterized protein n=1 Tax=Bodo saltans TaxID=75058 RepID=A0A0S4J4N2_BODSA|nr:Hypothetical protein, putative [Bodo saltans]|eukprot:CUG83387.1 Hypothetical protein, putative [Bodo saltans]